MKPIRQSCHPVFFWVIFLLALGLSGCSGSYPLSRPGMYDFGTRIEYAFTDADRANREVKISVWYPAKLPKDAPPSDYNYDAEPDRGGAPYPLILSSAKVGSIFAPHLASQGFVVVGISGQDSSEQWGKWLLDYPRDILFALQQVSAQPLPGLEGMIDSQRTGVMGYSFDSLTTLMLSGARVDPQYYLEQCAAAQGNDQFPPEWVWYSCNLADKWETFSEQAGSGLISSSDGLWQPLTDPRIQAVMPMGPEGALLFGERGLAAVDRPALIISAAEDDINPYDLEAVFIYEHMGGPQKGMITFLGQDHMMIYSEEPVAIMRHFAAAFFGYHLQGRGEYRKYFSDDFIRRHKELAWGVAAGK